MRKKYTAIPLSFTLIFLLLLTNIQPVYAAFLAEPQKLNVTNSNSGDKRSAAPNNRPLSSLEELVEWHSAPWVRNDYPVLAKDIIIDRPITLSETPKAKYLGAIEHIIRVTAGGSLTLNNSKLEVQGPQAVIVVETGGQLLLQRGAIYTASVDAIVVEKGGKFIKSEVFLIEGGKILDKNELPTDPKPDLPEENPPPPVQPTLPAISNTIGFDYSLTCLLGEPPALSDYPPTEWVTYETADKIPMQKELPVQWELDTVDFQTAGTYRIKGVFTADVLAANNLNNPKNISSTLQLTILKSGALDTLTGNVLSVGREGNCHIRLALPPLPEGATALYIHRSADGQNWKKAVQEIYINGNIPSSYDDFLPRAMITPDMLYVQYRYQTDYRTIYLRVEVIGSAVSGISNEIKLEMPLSAKPGDNINTGETGDDGGSGGNRGGGGQSEGDRTLPSVQAKPSEDTTLPTDKTLTADHKLPSVPALKQTSRGTIAPKDAVAGGISKGELSDKTTAQGKISRGSPPTSTPSDAENQEVAAASSFSTQETESTILEVQALTTEVQSSPSIQKSRGVLLTAMATVFATGILLLLRKSYKTRKRKP